MLTDFEEHRRRRNFCEGCPYFAQNSGVSFCKGFKDGGAEARPLDPLWTIQKSKCPQNRWVEGKEDFPAPEPGLLEKVVNFGIAVTSGQTDEETFQKRLATCKGCPALKTSSKGIFCGECGCGQNGLSELHKKLRFNKVKCPRRKLT